MSTYQRRRRLERFLSSRERKGFVCKTKRQFASREEALACQPSQTAYRCKTCCQWHLTLKKEKEQGSMRVSAAVVFAVLGMAAQVTAPGCKPRSPESIMWRGTPGPLVCSDSNIGDQYRCVGFGHVFLCIHGVEDGRTVHNCAPYVPTPVEER